MLRIRFTFRENKKEMFQFGSPGKNLLMCEEIRQCRAPVTEVLFILRTTQ